ncbi:unnamed protein product, partial [Prunus brigantina]
METLQREMTRMREHNYILSSKLEDAQKQLHEQQSRSAQLQDGLEETTQLRQERPQKSISKHNDQRAGKQPAQGGPSAFRRLFVPTSAEHHEEYQVYSDCRDRINARRRERQPTPIPVQAQLNDRHLDVLGPKSPLRRRYDEVGLEETDESDYIPTSLDTTLSRQSTAYGSAMRNDRRQRRPTAGHEAQGHDGQLPTGPQTAEPFRTSLPPEGLFLQKVNRIEEEQNQIRTPTWGKTDRLYSSDDLYTIRQGDSEPLREYAARFSHEYSRCPETDDRAAFGAFKSGLRASQFRYLVHNSNWTTYCELMKHAAIHAKAEHFNSKGVPSAPIGPTTNTGQPSVPTYDRFPPHQTINQAPYRTVLAVPATYTTGDKRRDSFQGRQDGGKRNKESGGRNFRGTKSDRPPEVFTILNSTYEHVLMAENQIIQKPSLRKLPRQVDKDTGVFCRYHQYNGHDTESCIAL